MHALFQILALQIFEGSHWLPSRALLLTLESAQDSPGELVKLQIPMHSSNKPHPPPKSVAQRRGKKLCIIFSKRRRRKRCAISLFLLPGPLDLQPCVHKHHAFNTCFCSRGLHPSLILGLERASSF